MNMNIFSKIAEKVGWDDKENESKQSDCVIIIRFTPISITFSCDIYRRNIHFYKSHF